jgi:hypothetical protein
MGLRAWLGRVFGRGQREWNFAPISAEEMRNAVPLEAAKVTYPSTPSTGRAARVLLGFEDGSEVGLKDDHVLSKEFVKLADRMTRRGLISRLAGGM